MKNIGWPAAWNGRSFAIPVTAGAAGCGRQRHIGRQAAQICDSIHSKKKKKSEKFYPVTSPEYVIENMEKK